MTGTAHARTCTADEKRERAREGEIEGGEDATSVVDGPFLYTDARMCEHIIFKILNRLPGSFEDCKLNQVRTEISSELNSDSSITLISGKERRGIGSCRCTLILGDI